MSRTILASCFVVCILLVGVAGAQPPSADANVNALARRHFREGSKAYSLGDFARAIREYRAAFEAKADPAFLYNIAQSYRLAGDPAQAIFFYRSYLRNVPEAPNRLEVENRIEALQPLVPRPKRTPPPQEPAVARPEQPPAPSVPSPALTPTATPAAATASVAPATTPLYKKWWLWTAVGVVAAGAAVGIGVGVTQSQPHFDAPLGTIGPASGGR